MDYYSNKLWVNPHCMFWGSGSGCSFHTTVFILSLSKKIMFVPYNSTTEFDLFQLVPLVYSWWSFTGFDISNKKEILGLSVRHLVTSFELAHIIHGSEGAGFLYDVDGRTTCQDENKESDVAVVTARLSIKWQLRIVAMLPNRLLELRFFPELRHMFKNHWTEPNYKLYCSFTCDWIIYFFKLYEFCNYRIFLFKLMNK